MPFNDWTFEAVQTTLCSVHLTMLHPSPISSNFLICDGSSRTAHCALNISYTGELQSMRGYLILIQGHC
jgi:hypothetical protein